MKATKHRFWLCALLVCMVLSVFAGITAPPAMAANISSTDWMETVPDETKLSNMSIPGTHDSCTQYVDMRYIFQCQDASVATQLIYGYRYLDMRLVLEQKHDQQTLVLKHSIARCKTSTPRLPERSHSMTCCATFPRFWTPTPPRRSSCA